MAVWHKGSLAGFDSTPVEIVGRIVGQKPGKWLFWDGIQGRWLPKEHCRWRRIKSKTGVMTMPQWLFKKARHARISNPEILKDSSEHLVFYRRLVRTLGQLTNIETYVYEPPNPMVKRIMEIHLQTQSTQPPMCR